MPRLERETARRDAQRQIAADDGKWSQDLDEAHYLSKRQNNFIHAGLRCQNCLHVENQGNEDENACEIVDGAIQNLGVCKLWVIPESLVVDSDREMPGFFKQFGSEYEAEYLAIHKIVKRGDEYCVTDASGDETIACFPTRQEALDQLRAIEAEKAAENAAHRDRKKKPAAKKNAAKPNKPEPAPGFEIKGIEIFKTGEWNGDKYNKQDLRDIVDAFKKVGFQVPIKLGHKEESGSPAFGWVSRLKLVGNRLVADFRDLPEKIYLAIRERRFDHVSSEIFFNLKFGGKIFRRALKAVAILGAEMPAVAGLKPLHDAKFTDLASEGVHTIVYRPEVSSMTIKELTAKLEDAKIRLAAATEADDKDDLEIAQLSAEVSGFRADIADMKATEATEQAATEAKKAKAAGGDAIEVKRLQEQVADLEKQNAETAEERRIDLIATKVKTLRVPALHDHFMALYDLASNATRKVTFTVGIGDKRKAQQVDAMRVVDDLVERINETAEKLFEQFSEAGVLRRDDEPIDEQAPGDEVDRLTRAYQSKHPDVKEYSVAMAKVLDDPANAALAEAYNRST